MTIKYIFTKDESTYAKRVEMKKGDHRLNVCWLYPEMVQEGETKSQAVDRMLKDADYEDREDYFNTHYKG